MHGAIKEWRHFSRFWCFGFIVMTGWFSGVSGVINFAGTNDGKITEVIRGKMNETFFNQVAIAAGQVFPGLAILREINFHDGAIDDAGDRHPERDRIRSATGPN